VESQEAVAFNLFAVFEESITLLLVISFSQCVTARSVMHHDIRTDGYRMPRHALEGYIGRELLMLSFCLFYEESITLLLVISLSQCVTARSVSICTYVMMHYRTRRHAFEGYISRELLMLSSCSFDACFGLPVGERQVGGRAPSRGRAGGGGARRGIYHHASLLIIIMT
jgi:hypothetical protein